MNDVYNKSDEEVWLALYLALIHCPKPFGNKTTEQLADDGLIEFKKRFRD